MHRCVLSYQPYSSVILNLILICNLNLGQYDLVQVLLFGLFILKLRKFSQLVGFCVTVIRYGTLYYLASPSPPPHPPFALVFFFITLHDRFSEFVDTSPMGSCLFRIPFHAWMLSFLALM